MNHRIISLIAALLIPCIAAFSQEPIWTKQMKVSEMLSLEKELNPAVEIKERSIHLTSAYYPLIDQYKVGLPLCVERPAEEYLPLYIEFFYTPADSIVRFISYDWEIAKFGNFFAKGEIWKEENKKFDLYTAEFERIAKNLKTLFGDPSSADEKEKRIASDNGEYFERSSIWDRESFFAKLHLIFASNTHRIRLTYYWK